jgi:multidrug resistance efflux pump
VRIPRWAVNIGSFLLVLGVGWGGWHLYTQAAQYVTTDDAFVEGKQITIAAPTSGQLVAWNGTLNRTFRTGDTVGEIEISPGATLPGANIPIGQPAQEIPVVMPHSGTIAEDNAVVGEFVAAGTPLAYAFDLRQLYVVANVKETVVNSLAVGDRVQVYPDALPGYTILGTVEKIEPATAATFSLIPQTSTNANFTKVTQVVPVKIALDSVPKGLLPGMSVTVRIDRAPSP